MKNNKGFTLIELIVVITILGILSTIGFISYSGYLIGVRDSNRVSQLTNLSETLNIYNIKYNLPLPTDYIEIKVNGKVIGYQGDLGKSDIEKLGYSSKGVDPKTNEYFSYYLTKDRSHFELMGFLEDQNNIAFNGYNQVNADDYSTKFPILHGDKLGILTDEFNTPVNKIQSYISAGSIDLYTTDSNTLFNAYIDNSKKYSFSGSILADKLETLSLPGKYGPPKDCPDGFIPAWGDAGFNQKGFCVAQYEMTYEDADTPNSCDTQYPDACNGGKNWNNVRYIPSKKIYSIPGKYPITNITETQAIKACSSMGKGYHLITNNEWMSISRDIELENTNWSSGISGEGFIYNGVSTDTNLGCNETGGNNESRGEGTKTGPGNNSCDSRRNLELFNGEHIWDLVGNVEELVNKANTINGNGFDLGQTSIAGSSNGRFWDNDGIYQLSDMKKYASIFNYGTSNGMGNIHYANGTTNNVFLRGGTARNGNDTGLYNILLGWTQESFYRDTGFRCAK